MAVPDNEETVAWDSEGAPTEPLETLFGDDNEVSPPDEPGQLHEAGSSLDALGEPGEQPAEQKEEAENSPAAPLVPGELPSVPETTAKAAVGGASRALKIINAYTPELVIQTQTPLPDLFLHGSPPGMDLTYIQQVLSRMLHDPQCDIDQRTRLGEPSGLTLSRSLGPRRCLPETGRSFSCANARGYTPSCRAISRGSATF